MVNKISLVKKRILFALTALIICGILPFSLVGCTKEKPVDYVALAIENAKGLLDEEMVTYQDIVAEPTKPYGGYDFYNLYVVLDDVEATDYAKMISILKILDKSHYGMEAFENSSTVFMEYVRCLNSDYHLSVYEYELFDEDYKVVYNSIAAKQGVGLSMAEKAFLYKELDDYLTARKNGRYEYTEDEAFKKVSDYYCVSVAFLKEQVWIYNVWQVYSNLYA